MVKDVFGYSFSFFDSTFFQTVIISVTAVLAYGISRRQNEISTKISNIEDSVEIYATGAVMKNGDLEIPVIHIQNVGTRLIYLDSYTFNGQIYQLGGQVRPSTYSQAENNFYYVELPTNGGSFATLEIRYRDVDDRRWKSIVEAKKDGKVWKVNTFARAIDS